MNTEPGILWRTLGVGFIVFQIAPLVLVVLFSFSDRVMTSFPIEGLTLHWWITMFVDDRFTGALLNSLLVAGIVALVSSVVGIMAALGFVRIPAMQANVGMVLLCLPVMMPPLVLAVSLVIFYVTAGLPLGLTTVIVSHILFTQPFVTIIVYARMAKFDSRVVESARDLGASPLQAFFSVTLPIIRPTVVGAALIAGAVSLDDFVLAYFTIGSGQNTLPTLVWGMMRSLLTPTVNAVGTLIVVLTISSTLIGLWLTRYRG